jgi:hypothetical protein
MGAMCSNLMMLTLAAAAPALPDAGKTEGEGFRLIELADLVKLQKGPKPVYIYDANGPGTRAKEGIIPGARLLASISDYDVAKELPADKSATLVFYCHNRM